MRNLLRKIFRFRIKILLVSILFFTAFNISAETQSYWYAGSSYADLKYNNTSEVDTLNFKIVLFKFGIRLDKYFAVEIRPATFASTEDTTGGRIKNIRYLAGLYGKAFIPIFNGKSNIHWLFGYTWSPIFNRDTDVPRGHIEDVQGYSYAVGFDINLVDNIDLVIEQMHYILIQDKSLSALEIGINMKF